VFNAIEEYPEFVVLCRAHWILDGSVFRHNRYSVPPKLKIPFNNQGWMIPVEVIPPSPSFIDERERISGALFLTSRPPLHCIDFLQEFISYRNINMVYVIGDGSIPMELIEGIIASADYWEKITVAEVIARRHLITNILWWRLKGRNRILLLEAVSDRGMTHSVALSAHLIAQYFGLTMKSATTFIRLRCPFSDIVAIENYLGSTASSKTVFTNKVVELFDSNHWDETSSYGRATFLERLGDNLEPLDNLIVKKFEINKDKIACVDEEQIIEDDMDENNEDDEGSQDMFTEM